MPATAKLLPIIKVPDPILRQEAMPVSEITDGTRQLLDDMAATMYAAPGIGLAAPQVNISLRVIVIDCGKDNEPELIKMINPQILSISDTRSILERAVFQYPIRPLMSNVQPK